MKYDGLDKGKDNQANIKDKQKDITHILNEKLKLYNDSDQFLSIKTACLMHLEYVTAVYCV